jgi:DedD protein
MERRVKERLVGATILVVLIVLIVPELLSGPQHAAAPPPPGPVHSYTIDVESHATAPAGNTPDQAPWAATLPAAAEAPSASAVASAAAERSATALPPTVDLHSSETTPKFDRAWSVQLGSFANEDNAGAFARDLRAKGFAAYVSKTAAQGSRYRVRVGPFADREAALRLESQLKSGGRAATLVAPGN